MSSIEEKIQKLLSLASSPNTNEAKMAMEKAQKLMAEYGMNQDQFSPKNNSPKAVESEKHECKQPFQKIAAMAAAEIYACSVVSYGNQEITFVGRSHNIRATEMTWSFFLLQIEEWYKSDLPQGLTQKARAKFRKDYKFSMAHTLLKRSKEVTPPTGSTALVIHRETLKEEVQDFFEDQGITTKKKTRARKVSDFDAYLKGAHAGNQADLNRPEGHKRINEQ